MKSRFVLPVVHLLGCLAFLALPYVLNSDGWAKLAEIPSNAHEQRNLASYLLTIGLFYLNFYVLIPKLFFRRKYIFYGLLIVGIFGIVQYTLVQINRGRVLPGSPFRDTSPRGPDHPQRADNESMPFPRQPPPPDRLGERPPFPQRPFGESNTPPWDHPERTAYPVELSQTFFLFLVSFLLSLMLRIYDRWRETEREKAQTELSYLRAQINPHFLFNTLNSIYSLAIEQSPMTAEAIVKLSAFLRYITREAQQERVPLRAELDYISQYVTLQKLRLDDTVQLHFSTEGPVEGRQIAPLILISFIENAFKYGVNPEEPSLIQIRITVRGNELRCHVFNKKVRVFQDASSASGGIGLANTKARLQLLYPDRHRLQIDDQPGQFTVDLALTLS